MKVMALISSTINLSLIILILFGFGCASKGTWEVLGSKVKPPPRVQKIQEINNTDLKGFEEKSAEYGLEGVQATHIYAVDLNKDGNEDLIFLPNYFSTPEFYYFSKKEPLTVLKARVIDQRLFSALSSN